MKTNYVRIAGLLGAGLTLSAMSFGQGIHLKGGQGVPRYLTVPGEQIEEPTTDAGTGLPYWNGTFTYSGKNYTYRMVGTNPSNGSVPTTVPVTIVPVIFKIAGVTFDPTQNANDSNTPPLNSFLLSPIFQNAPFTAGGMNLGTSQYIDSFQRANFWSTVSTTSPGYHVLLGAPTVHSPVTINVPPAQGSTASIPNPPYNSTIGEVNYNYYNAKLTTLLKTVRAKSNQFTIFFYYNVFFYQNLPSNCCILGYHGATSGSTRAVTYGNMAYNDPGIFVDGSGNPVPIEDIHVSSHEIGEWMDDPAGTNTVPGWSAGQASGSCQTNLEVGDPVTGIAFEVTLNGFTYHPEDLVFVPWFARQTPSTSVNGWYTFLNTYPTPPSVCN